MAPEDLEQQIAGLAALDEPTRRSLYFYVVDRQQEVSREEAAQAVGVSHHLAGFHLDRLVTEGLLEASFRRLSGRAGPGAGRPAKLYRRSSRQLEISLPQRSYELAARILAAAIESSDVAQTGTALRQTARKIGERIGADIKAQVGSRPGRKRLLAASVAALAAHGYEPEQATGEVRLRNCPFHALVSEHKDLVCGMNLALIEGFVHGVDLSEAKPVLTPAPGRCCVSLKLGTK
ncbi:MAG: helix-turn-helix transcriptional regulator [Gammaproteobacteria bacterium]